MKKIFFSLVLLTPTLVLAQDLSKLDDFTTDTKGLVGNLIGLVFALALLFFLWGLAKYIFAAGDEAAKETGKNIMFWGIIALFIMASVLGIIALLQEIFGVGEVGNLKTLSGSLKDIPGKATPPPTFPTPDEV